MVTVLTTYQTNSISGILSTANKLSITHGTDNVNVTQLYTLIGTSTGWGEVCSQGAASAWPALGAIGSPTGKGWFLDSSVLSLLNQTLIAGNYTANTRLNTGHNDGTQTGTIGSCEIHLRWYKYNTASLVYTLIVEMVLTGQTINSTITTFALPSTAGTATSLSTNEVVYQDIWINIGTNTFGDAALYIRLNRQSTNNTGDSNTQVVSPGYLLTVPASSSQQMLDTFTSLNNWVSMANGDGSCATRGDLSNSQNCQTGYFAANSFQNTNAIGINGGIVGHADVLSGTKKGWQIHSANSFSIPGIFAARVNVTGDTGGDGTYEKIAKSFFLFADAGDTSGYWYSDFAFYLEQNNPNLDGFPGQATPCCLNTIIYAGSGSGYPSTQLNPLYLDSSMFGDYITVIFKIEQMTPGTSSTVWKTTYQIVNERGQTITIGSTQTTHANTITSLQVWFDEHWIDPTGGQQTNYNWQPYGVRWFYYSGDVTDQTPYTIGDNIPATAGRHAGFDLASNGFVVGVPGSFGNVAFDAQSGTSVAVLDLYQRSAQLTTLSLSDAIYAFLASQNLFGGVLLTDTNINIDQVQGTPLSTPYVPVNIAQVGGQSTAMGGSDAQTAANTPLYVIGVYNGTTVDRHRSGLGDGAASTGLPNYELHIYNGSTYDRARGASVGDAAAATGILANQPMVYNGTTYDRMREVSGDAVAAAGIQANQSMIYNGTNYDRAREVAGDAQAAAGIAASQPMVYNGTNYDRWRNNADLGALITAAGVTTGQTGSDQTNNNWRGVIVVLDMTTVGTGSVTLTIQGKDAGSGKYYTLLAGAAVVTNSTNAYVVYPGAPATTNVSTGFPLPKVWRVITTANNANATTYKVSANVIV